MAQRALQEALMDHYRHFRTLVLALLSTSFSISHPVAAETPANSFANDPSITIKYLPGKYYEQAAQDAVKHKNFRQALERYQQAGYWGNKIAQYDVGMLYLNGADGVPADKVRGTAWLGIAAQTHQPYVDKALADAYASLNAEQRASAGELWKQLKVDYDDKITLDRASKHFNDELIKQKGSLNGPPEYTDITYGSFGGGGGDQSAHPIFDPNTGALQGGRNDAVSHSVNAAKFIAAVNDQFSEFVHVQFGAVQVGEPESVSEHEQRVQQGAEKKQ
jgi:hypothetical protein